jgi:hypothetical protein
MNTAQVIATCSLPPGFLRAGDRLEVMVDAEQVGPSVPWNLRVQWGATQWMQRVLGVGETNLSVRGQAALHSGGTTLATQHFNGAGAMLIGVLPASDPFQAGLAVVVSGWVNSISTGSSVAVRNLTVIRHPAQVN